MRQFIADAGHQLRTPLTVVQGFIAILRRGGFENKADRERILDTMNAQSRIMGSLIDKLILLERWESPEAAPAAAPIDVGTLVADLVAPDRRRAPRPQLRALDAVGILAAIDPTELGYVVTNLSRQRRQIRRGKDRRARARARFVERSSKSPIKARAFRRPTPARVFDRFYRGTQRDVPGSGLGLAIVKRAVERAHGTITLDSSPSGSRFTVQLPLALVVDSRRFR